MRKITYIFAGLVVLALCWVRISSVPPSDAALIKQFYSNRQDFEKLQAMLQKDSNIFEVAAYGVSTNLNEIGPLTWQQAGLKMGRYDEYLATFKQAGVILAWHRDEEFYFLVRRWGFAGEGWGIAIVWRADEPTNQVATLDNYLKGDPGRSGVYRHVEGKWYLWMHAT